MLNSAWIMPILEVEIIGTVNKENIAQPLADAAAEVLKTGPGRTWVKVRFLPSGQYAENGGAAGDIHPVFVSVLLGRCNEIKEKAEIASGLAAALSRVLDRPAENVHVLFEPEAIGRIAFGGKLRTE